MIDPLAFFLGAFLLLVLPLHWILAAVIAAVCHELCHMGAVYALGGRVLSFRIGPTGAVMETELDGPGRECIAALAGPAGSFLLLLFGRVLPHVAVCGLIQGAFNLLPLYPLDGGRALRCLLEGYPKRSIIEGLFALLTALAALRFSKKLALLLILRAGMIKILANKQNSGYNRKDTILLK